MQPAGAAERVSLPAELGERVARAAAGLPSGAAARGAAQPTGPPDAREGSVGQREGGPGEGAQREASGTHKTAGKYLQHRSLHIYRRPQILSVSCFSQEQVRAEQADVTQQREQLFRKLEALSSQGYIISPSIPAREPAEAAPTPTPAPTPSPPVRTKDSAKWKAPPKTALPINLISATNQQKVN